MGIRKVKLAVKSWRADKHQEKLSKCGLIIFPQRELFGPYLPQLNQAQWSRWHGQCALANWTSSSMRHVLHSILQPVANYQ